MSAFDPGLRVVALLPMKAHSERVSGKNFREFRGRPLYRWMLDTLLSLPEVAEVVIDTDARDLLASHGTCENERLRILDRPAELCGDHVSMNRILEHDIASVAADLYLMTHTTNPLLGAGSVRAALEAFHKQREAEGCDSLFSVNRFQTRFYREDGSAVNHDPAELIRTQDLEPWYEENSNLYLFTRESFAATGARIGSQPLLFETSLAESVDIDDAAGWRLASLIACGLAEEEASS
jgi:CMP-N-acetylneuraminic acid synthetase